MQRTRLAVVGVGHLGKEHARILAALPQVELVGVVDARADQVAAVAQRCDTRPFTDHRPLLGQVEGAVVAVPTLHHHAVAGDFLRAGVPLLIEKPLATTLAEADDLLRLAHRHGAFVQVGHIERFNPAFEELSRLPLRPKLIQGQRLAPFSGRSLDIGVVLDLMIHDIDIALSLVRAPVRQVEALGVSVLGGQEDMAQARLTFANGCIAELSASRLHSGPVRRMELWSAEGFAAVDFQHRHLSLIQPSEQLRSRQPVDIASFRADPGALLRRAEVDCTTNGPDQLTRELEEFATAVRTGSAVRVTGEQGREALSVACQILDAIQRHNWEGEVEGPSGPYHLPAALGSLFPVEERRAAA